MFNLKLSSFNFLLSLFTPAILLVHQVAANYLLNSGVMFPLYIYPGANCAGWAPVIQSIQVYSTNYLPFYIIVSPGSGPGGLPGSQPDANYQACIASLRSAASYHAVTILGYVFTDYTQRNSSLVIQDIDTYSQWSTAYRPDGIFFDQVTSSASYLPVYTSYTNEVHRVFGSSGFVVVNPGTTADSGYFSIANMVVTYEGPYANFSVSGLTIGAATPANKQVLLLYAGPTTLPLQLIDQTSGSTVGIGSSYITYNPKDEAYTVMPSYWESFVNMVVGAQVVGTPAGPDRRELSAKFRRYM